MAITEKMYLYNDILLDNKTALGTISSQLTAHSSQLTAHSSQLTAHSSQLTKSSLIKIIFYFTIQNLLLKRAVSEFLCDSFALQIIRWLLFFYVYLVLRQAEFISASGFRNKFAVTENGCIRN